MQGLAKIGALLNGDRLPPLLAGMMKMVQGFLKSNKIEGSLRAAPVSEVNGVLRELAVRGSASGAEFLVVALRSPDGTEALGLVVIANPQSKRVSGPSENTP